MPDRPRDLRGREHRRADLVEQGLEQVMVALVDDGDAQPRSGCGADDDDMMRRCFGQGFPCDDCSVIPATAYPAARQASSPPCNGRTFLNPWFMSTRATRAADASLGHEQYRTMSRSRGRSLMCLA